MIYYLTQEQWSKFWRRVEEDNPWIYYTDRLHIWDTSYKEKFKLDYEEGEYKGDIGYHGMLKGLEHDINWFLLQI